ncbi:MAG: hypothetical protein KF902_05895 [Phycisphaeraceae bacterium]|nr:hypothetical protein [Phycisphaeraceae bacterium]
MKSLRGSGDLLGINGGLVRISIRFLNCLSKQALDPGLDVPLWNEDYDGLAYRDLGVARLCKFRLQFLLSHVRGQIISIGDHDEQTRSASAKRFATLGNLLRKVLSDILRAASSVAGQRNKLEAAILVTASEQVAPHQVLVLLIFG